MIKSSFILFQMGYNKEKYFSKWSLNIADKNLFMSLHWAKNCCFVFLSSFIVIRVYPYYLCLWFLQYNIFKGFNRMYYVDI